MPRSPRYVAHAREALDSRGKHRFGCQKDIDVDNRFCHQTGNGGAANELNGRRHLIECIGNSCAKELKQCGPAGIVLQDDDGIVHSCRQA